MVGGSDGFGDQEECDEGGSGVGVSEAVRGCGVPLIVLNHDRGSIRALWATKGRRTYPRKSRAA